MISLSQWATRTYQGQLQIVGSNEADSRFPLQMRKALSYTNETDRQLLLAIAHTMASKTA